MQIIKRYKVVPEKDVVKNQIPLVKQAKKYSTLKDRVLLLSKNPYSRQHNGEKLKATKYKIYSMHLFDGHRICYRIKKFNTPKKITTKNKKSKIEIWGYVFIYEIWGHYTHIKKSLLR